MWTPIRHVTLHFRDLSGGALLAVLGVWAKPLSGVNIPSMLSRTFEAKKENKKKNVHRVLVLHLVKNSKEYFIFDRCENPETRSTTIQSPFAAWFCSQSTCHTCTWTLSYSLIPYSVIINIINQSISVVVLLVLHNHEPKVSPATLHDTIKRAIKMWNLFCNIATKRVE